MGMRGDFVSIRKLEALGVEAFLARLASALSQRLVE
jgi:hypothetical protein